jgi:hypothetical protein
MGKPTSKIWEKGCEVYTDTEYLLNMGRPISRIWEKGCETALNYLLARIPA